MNLWVFIFLIIQLIVVSAIDIRKSKISNRWVLLNLGLAPVVYFTFPSTYHWDWAVLFFPLGFIIFGFILFLMGIMGAGDSKFLASLFLLIPGEEQWNFAEMLLYATLLVGFLLLVRTIVKKRSEVKAYLISHHWRGLLSLIESRFSYAPVILIAFSLTGVLKWF